MNLRNWAIALMSLTLVAGSLGAITLTEQQAVTYALANNTSLALAQLDVQSQQRKSNYSYNSLLPTVQVASTVNMGMPGVFKGADEPTFTWVNSLSASWAFNPAMVTNIEVARKQYEAGLITYEENQAQTALNVRKLFYGLLLQQQSLEVQQAALKQTAARLQQIEANYTLGYIPQLSVLQMQASYDSSKSAIEKARLAMLQQGRTFSLLLGLDPDEELTLVGEIPTGSFSVGEFDSTQSLDNRFDLAAINAQRSMLEVQHKALSQQVFIPTIQLGISYSPTIADMSQPWTGTIGTYPMSVSNFSDKGSMSMTVAMNLTNLLPQSSARQGLADVQDAKAKLDMSALAVRQGAVLEIENLLGTIGQAQLDLSSSEQTIGLLQKIYDLTQESYQFGTTELLDVQDALLQLQQAQMGRLSNQYTYLCAVLDLEYALQRGIL